MRKKIFWMPLISLFQLLISACDRDVRTVPQQEIETIPEYPLEIPAETVFTGKVWQVSSGESINEAIAAAEPDDIILVSEGTYEENIIINKRIALIGGSDGSGDPGRCDPTARLTVINGNRNTATVTFFRNTTVSSSGARIEGFTLTGGKQGIGTDGVPENLVITRNVIRDNGIVSTDRNVRGGGLYLVGNGFRVTNNIIRDNYSGMGGGLYVRGSNILIGGNLISGNIAYSDHGGATYLFGNPILFTDNIVEYNTVSGTPGSNGSGGGIFLDGKDSVAYVSRCITRFNHANSYGAGMSSDGGAVIYADHVLVYGNTSGQSAPGVYISAGDPEPGTIYLEFCTISGNRSPATESGNGLDARGGTAHVRNCIFWDSDSKTLWAHPDPHMRDPSQGGIILMTYSLTDTAIPWTGTGNLNSDPQFADSAAGDFHLKSTSGRWTPVLLTWVTDTILSPAVDAADPVSSFEKEPEPNGSRADIGYYGNSAEASKSH